MLLPPPARWDHEADVCVAGAGGCGMVMDAYQAHASVAEPGGTLVSYAVIMLGGIQVNREGRRFADEARGYSEHAVDVLRQPGARAVEIFDQRILSGNGLLTALGFGRLAGLDAAATLARR